VSVRSSPRSGSQLAPVTGRAPSKSGRQRWNGFGADGLRFSSHP